MTASSSSSSGPSASAVTFPGQVDARCEVELLRRLCQVRLENSRCLSLFF